MPVKPTGAHLDGLDALLSIVQVSKAWCPWELGSCLAPVACIYSQASCCQFPVQRLRVHLLPPCPSQMPKGVPVATVAIGNAANAGLLAVRWAALPAGPLLLYASCCRHMPAELVQLACRT